jgi:hypothetical protein
MPGSGLNLRQRFTLWFGEREVTDGGPYTRQVTAEKAAAQLLAAAPLAAIRISREQLELVEQGLGVEKRWVASGTVWMSP